MKRLYFTLLLSLVGITAILLVLIVPVSFSKEQPPKVNLVVSVKFKNVADDQWTNLEFEKDVQSSGLYYIELTNCSGTVGCWGSKKDPYRDGTAWQDGEPLEGCDFSLQYRPKKKGEWEDITRIEHLNVINDFWFPFPLHEAEESIGQTFIAPEVFTGVGVKTPTWASAASGCTISLWSTGQQPVKPTGKLATNWGRLRLEL